MIEEIQLRRGTAAAWTAANPTLGPGEPGFETDTNKLKIGDGSTPWNSLAYFAAADIDAVASVFGRTGAIVAQSADYSAFYDALGAASTAQTTAESYANQYAGSAAGTIGKPLSATDSTVTNARTPSGSAGGDLTGSFPNPTLAATAVTPGAYTSTNLSVDAKGRITAASSGANGGVVENVNTISASGAAQTIPDVTTATLNVITLTANCTFTFPAVAAGKSFSMALIQGGSGSYTVTWPAGVKWPAGTAPTLTLTLNKTDSFSFVSFDGVFWLGYTTGENY